MNDPINEFADARRQLDLLESIVALLESGCADDSDAGIMRSKAQIVHITRREQQRQLARLDRAKARIDAALQSAPPRPPARSVPVY